MSDEHHATGPVRPPEGLAGSLFSDGEARDKVRLMERDRRRMRKQTRIGPRRVSVVLALVVYGLAAAPAQTFRLSGRVTDNESGEALGSATVRIAGTPRGTITNVDGRYALRISPGPASLVFSYVGYRTDTVSLAVTSDRVLDVSLTPIAIELQEIVVTSEDPAVGIMRKVIEKKHRWREALHAYRFSAFTRQLFRRDTAIASISESYTLGYWRRGDTLREVVTQKRQTENIPIGRNFAFVGQIENFYDDELDFLGFRFVGPTSPEAFDYYRFVLEGIRESGGVPLYDIRMEPRSRVTPLFSGRLSVIGDSYALVGLDVAPNEAFVIPFVSDLAIRYSQGFGQYGGQFWMPTDIRVSGSVQVGIVGLSMPRIGFEQTSTIYEYQINSELPDSVFTKRPVTSLEESTTFDSTFWAANEVLPLTAEEQAAYGSIDSTQTLDKQFAPSGPLAAIGEGGLSWLEYVDVRFNRVEGLFLGGKVSIDTLLPRLSLTAKAGYGLSDDRLKYALGATVRLHDGSALATGLQVYDDIAHFHDELQLDALGVSLTSLFAKSDPRDYYSVRGFTGFVEASPLDAWMVRLRYRDEQHRSVVQTTDYSFFFRDRSYRAQPEASEGRLRALAFETRLGGEPIPFNIASRDFLELELERSPGRSLASDFDYTWLRVSGEYSVADFLRRSLFPPTLIVRASLGASWGAVLPQRLFSLPSSVAGFGPIGVLRGSRVREFGGTQIVTVAVEQNFRSVPFLLLDIPFLYKNGIELMVHGAFARSWARQGSGTEDLETRGWYAEAGAGIGKIFGFIRCDLTYRFYDPTRFVFTVAISRIL